MENMIKLSHWAKNHNIDYKEAWKQVKSGVFPHKTKISNTNRIWVEDKASEKELKNAVSPLFAGLPTKETVASTRRNRASTIERTDKFVHIENGIDPFQSTRSNNKSNDYTNVNDAIRLTQKSYYNFSIFRNTIDIMTEFSSNNIFLKGGNAKSRKFFEDLFKKINISDLQDKFFREYYRSSNVFIYRFGSKPQENDVLKLNKLYNSSAKDLELPTKYIILNPVDIMAGGNISFASTIFYKNLNSYEINRLKNPVTQNDKDFLASLPPEKQKEIKDGATSILIQLDPKYIYSIFYKKQDYEPLAIPMGFPVLKDLNYKEEMKEIDMAISRTTHRVILLVTMGYESKNGDYMVDKKTIDATQALFENESIGKVLVADFTTKAQFIVPPIADLLDPRKYEIVNEDIKIGLNNILVGKNEKFANQHIQVNLFVQRLIQAREVFLNQFLIPEIERIGKEMGFKSYPEPYFQDFDLKDEAEFNRIVLRLAEIGFFTPEETFTAMQNGRFPTKEESEINQSEFIKLKEKGFYEPILGGPATQKELLDINNKQQLKMQENQHSQDIKMADKEAKQAAKENKIAGSPNLPKGGKVADPSGRPTGTTRKQSTKKVSPIGKSKASLFSLSKTSSNLVTANELLTNVKKSLSNKFNVKELNKEQINTAECLTEAIMMNENIKNWNSESINKYINQPDFQNEERYRLIQDLAYEYQIDNFLASILYESYNNDSIEENA